MYYVKKAIYGPDPAEQKRKVKAQIRRNQRELDKQLTGLQTTEQKTKTMIKAAAKRNDMKSARLLAREVFRAKKQKERLHRSKAQLNSVALQVDEAFALRKIEGTMKSSTLIMKEVSNLVKLPELMGTMNALSQELMKVRPTRVDKQAPRRSLVLLLLFSFTPVLTWISFFFFFFFHYNFNRLGL